MTKKNLTTVFFAALGPWGACAGNHANSKATPDSVGETAPDGNDQGRVASSKKYVAMGSSFAAGPGIPEAVPGQACGRSTGNYPHLVAADLGLVLTDVSCIAATIDNIATTPRR